MKIIKQFVPVRADTKQVNEQLELNLNFGTIGWDYGRRRYPNESFDTEDEAIKYAYETDKYADWVILPVIKFDNFE